MCTPCLCPSLTSLEKLIVLTNRCQDNLLKIITYLVQDFDALNPYSWWSLFTSCHSLEKDSHWSSVVLSRLLSFTLWHGCNHLHFHTRSLLNMVVFLTDIGVETSKLGTRWEVSDVQAPLSVIKFSHTVLPMLGCRNDSCGHRVSNSVWVLWTLPLSKRTYEACDIPWDQDHQHMADDVDDASATENERNSDQYWHLQFCNWVVT